MSASRAVRTLLEAFLGVFTQPFEQSLRDSLTAAATAITLAGLESLAFLPHGASRTPTIVSSSLLVVLVWMAITAVISNRERIALTMARNLSVVSFWIAVTLVLVLAVGYIRADAHDSAIRFLVVTCVLFVLVPVHVFRNLPLRSAMPMTVALLLSTVTLAWLAEYGRPEA